MAYKVIILYQLYMPSYFLGTFTEYPYTNSFISTYKYPLKACNKTFRGYSFEDNRFEKRLIRFLPERRKF